MTIKDLGGIPVKLVSFSPSSYFFVCAISLWIIFALVPVFYNSTNESIWAFYL